MNYNIESLPPSYSYQEVINIIKPNQIAYCYIGANKGSIIFRKKDNSVLIFYKNDKSINNRNFELWALIHQISNGIIRQNAVNRWYEVFNYYHNYLDLYSYNFKIE